MPKAFQNQESSQYGAGHVVYRPNQGDIRKPISGRVSGSGDNVIDFDQPHEGCYVNDCLVYSVEDSASNTVIASVSGPQFYEEVVTFYIGGGVAGVGTQAGFEVPAGGSVVFNLASNEYVNYLMGRIPMAAS